MFRLNIEIAGKADGDLAEQYKSRRNAYALCKQAENINYDSFILTHQRQPSKQSPIVKVLKIVLLVSYFF